MPYGGMGAVIVKSNKQNASNRMVQILTVSVLLYALSDILTHPKKRKELGVSSYPAARCMQTLLGVPLQGVRQARPQRTTATAKRRTRAWTQRRRKCAARDDHLQWIVASEWELSRRRGRWLYERV